jgi:phage shock protein A
MYKARAIAPIYAMISSISSMACSLLCRALEVSMNRVKRWTMSVTSWVDQVLAQVENHEATVSSAIGRVRHSTARARVQLKRVERDQQTLRDALLQEEKAREAWRRRAKAADDEVVALECLRRHKASERRALSLRQRLAEHEQSHKELSEGVRVLSTRLCELTERKNLMRTRQSRAEAAQGMAGTVGPMGDLEDMFERWETRVGEIEIASECADPIDAFEAELDAVEESAELRLELEELRADKS